MLGWLQKLLGRENIGVVANDSLLSAKAREVSAPKRVPLRTRTLGGRVTRAAYLADGNGEYPTGGLDTFARMMRDAQVRACIQTKQLSVLSETAEVHPGDDSEAAKTVAEQVREQLTRIPGGIAGIVTGLLDALPMGFALGEKVWAEDGTLARVLWHDPRRFSFVADTNGDITVVELTEGNRGITPAIGGISTLPFPIARFVHFAYGGAYGSPYGESDLVGAYRSWTAKDELLRMWLAGLDRFGTPTPVGKTPAGIKDEDSHRFSGLLANLQSGTSIVLPQGYEVDFAFDTGRVEPAKAYVTAVTYQDQQIARVILGGELTSSAGNGSGSYALGSVHEAVLADRVQALRSAVAEVITRQVAAPIAVYMHGPRVVPPIIKFPNLTPAEVTARVDLMQKMIAGQVVAPAESWVRAWLGLPTVQ